MAIPLYKPLTGSPFSIALSELGFTYCHAISTASPNAFYQILAQGLAAHIESKYPCSPHLVKSWRAKIKNLIAVYEGNVYRGGEQYSDPSYWDALGQALIQDICQNFDPNKPFIPTVRLGKELDKAVKAPYDSITTLLNIALIWYEQREDGGNLRTMYITANQHNPQVYVCIANEGQSYYLLYHNRFNPERSMEGFPFYTQTSADSSIPKMGESQAVASDLPQEITTECVNTLITLSAKLAALLGKLGPQSLPAECAGEQKEIKEMRDKVCVLADRCGCSPKPLFSEEFERILTVAERKEQEVSVKPTFHNATNCESFPEFQLDVNHNGEWFHKYCLECHVRSLPATSATFQCPRCNTPLSENLLQDLVPDIMHSRKINKVLTLNTLSRVSPTMPVPSMLMFPPQQPPPQPAPPSQAYNFQNQQFHPQSPTHAPYSQNFQTQCFRCQDGIPKGREVLMDCGNKLCAKCGIEAHNSGNRICPCCGGLLSFQENDILVALYAKTVY